MALSLSSSSSFLSPLLRTKFVSTKSQLLKLGFTYRPPAVLNASYSSSSSFSWEDVHEVISERDDSTTHSSNLNGFFQRIRTCNRGFEMKSEFLPFVIEEQIAGYVHNQFESHLRKFQDVFAFPEDNLFGNAGGGYIILNPSLKSPEDRTKAVGEVVKCLGEGVIPGIRNELYPVTTSYGEPVYFSLERAAAPFFGIKAYGIHMNGYVDRDGEKSLWIGKRSERKPTFPGMLDHLAAGGLGVPCKTKYYNGTLDMGRCH
ncbi:hypothetical protein MKW94_015089 [Papaver nudicaule]|uniref:DUF4743 domain-containing protein n=1 Tax=Papaver nudicaule TaxID=74823 RepID=A0AA42B4C9_PAPNU|nr:hypothetical protein [Papaver nudicaule]